MAHILQMNIWLHYKEGMLACITSAISKLFSCLLVQEEMQHCYVSGGTVCDKYCSILLVLWPPLYLTLALS